MNHQNTPEQIKFIDLISNHWQGWFVVWLLAIMTVIAMISLLILSALHLIQASRLPSFILLSWSPIWIGVLAVIRTFARYSELVLSHQLIFNTLKHIRIALFTQLARLDVLKNLTSVDLQMRLVKDIDVLNEFILRFINPILVACVSSAFALVILAYLEPANKLITAGLMMIMLLCIVSIISYGIYICIRHAKHENQYINTRKATLQYAMPALTQLIIWQKWSAISQLVMQDNQALYDTYQSVMRIRRLVFMMMQYLLALFLLILMVLNANHPSFLLIIVFVFFVLADVLTAVIYEPLSFGRGLIAHKRLNNMIHNQSVVLPKKQLPNDFVLMADKLSVKQPNAVFGACNINFILQKSVPLVVAGVSGGGKSTLLSVLAGELKAHDGHLFLKQQNNTHDWTSYAHNEQNDIGYLGQKIDIFNQSLQDNLRLGNLDATEAQMISVLKDVALDDWLSAQPLGLKTELGEYGQAVSGGQARRIALARLLLKPKKLLLLDEPFAGLDKANRDKLWQKLKQHQKDAYLVVVSHHDDLDTAGCVLLNIGDPVVI